MTELCAKGEVFVWDCPSQISELFNEVPALLAKAKIASFRVPYQCSSCKKEIPVRLDAASLNPDDVSSGLCVGCDGKLRVQRNPEVLIDLRPHASTSPSGVELKPVVRILNTQLDGRPSDYLVDTASDLPHAFESTNTDFPPKHPSESSSESTQIDGGVLPSEHSGDTTLPEEPDDGATIARTLSPFPEPQGVVEERPVEPRAAVAPAVRPFASAGQVLPLLPVAVVALAGIVVGSLATLTFTENGLPSKVVISFATLLNEGSFQEATTLLDNSEEELPPGLVVIYRQEIERARLEAARVYAEEAVSAFKEKRFEEAVRYARDALGIEDPDGKMLFLLADALRLSGNAAEAEGYYQQFAEKFPDDRLADDAMYWRASALASQGQYELATSLCERVLSDPKSNFHTAAKRLLREMPD
jgi:hypothetical protein